MITSERLAAAMFGCILRDPEKILSVDKIEFHESDFVNHRHWALYKAIRELASLRPTTGRPFYDLTQESGGRQFLQVLHQAAAEGRAGFTVDDLNAARRQCERPDLIADYVCELIEVRALDTIRAHAQRIAAQLRDAPTLRAGVTAALSQAITTETVLQNLADRLAVPAADIAEPAAEDDTERTATDTRAFRLNLPQRALARLAGSPAYQAVRREDALLRSLVRHPEQIEHLRWLRPQDFTDPQRGKIYQVIVDRYERRRPITPLLVLSDAQKAGLVSAHPRSGDRFIKRYGRGPAVAAVAAGKQILDHAAAATIRDGLTRLSATTGGGAREGVLGAFVAIDAITAVQERHTLSRGYRGIESHPFPPAKAAPYAAPPTENAAESVRATASAGV